jgi:hypothetical protein
VKAYSSKCLKRLSEKTRCGLWRVGFGSATLQEQALCAAFQQFVRSSIREFKTFQTVSKAVFYELRLLKILRSPHPA